MNDIIPPRKKHIEPLVPPQAGSAPIMHNEQSTSLSEKIILPPPLDIDDKAPSQKPRRLRRFLLILALFAALLIAASFTSYTWYKHEQEPLSRSSKQVRITIESGEQPQEIAEKLQKSGLIRSTLIFDWYTRVHHSAGSLQAGVYSMSPNMSLSEIIGHLTSGKTDTFTITFLPGATLSEDKAVLKDVGYTSEEIEAATTNLSQYTSPLFDGKPTSSDLEGYIYGESYQFSADAKVHDILQRTFDQYESVIKQHDLEAAFKSHGLTLYQGITLASIVQREMSSHVGDMAQVAQVFYSRLAINMPLGSDVTFEYAAKKLGVIASPTLDSPYNTRIHVGLPPGPIATPGIDALEAVANPASGSYMFFLSGDDGKTYFAMTDAEHEQNIIKHCQKACLAN